MLQWVVLFLVLALAAGILGFSGVAGTAAAAAKVLFVVFVALLIVTGTMQALSGRTPTA